MFEADSIRQMCACSTKGLCVHVFLLNVRIMFVTSCALQILIKCSGHAGYDFYSSYHAASLAGIVSICAHACMMLVWADLDVF